MARVQEAMGKKRDAIKQVEKTDIAVSREAAKLRDTAVVRAMGAVGQLGDQPPLIILSLAVAAAGLLRRDRAVLRTGGRMLAAHLLATAVKGVVKRSVDRTRPALLVDEGRYELKAGERNEGPYNSFPSGHTAGAVAVARALSRDFPETRLGGYVAAGTIAAVQVPRCHHFASDTAAGALIGLASEAIASAVYDRLVPTAPS